MQVSFSNHQPLECSKPLERDSNQRDTLIAQYKKAMLGLIYEKEPLPAGKLEEKRRVSKERAHNLFNIEDAEAAQQVEKYIEELTSCKPGRKLFKYLAKHSQSKISIVSGDKCAYNFRYNQISLDLNGDNHTYFYTMNRNFEKKTCKGISSISFAHELIHYLHEGLGIRANSRTIESKIIRDIQSLEEQHTILGFQEILFHNREISKIDVLSQNAFHFAFNLPPRINHAGGKLDDEIASGLASINDYFEWMEASFEKKFHREKENDPEYFLKILRACPSALQQIPEQYKRDIDFMVEAFCIPDVVSQNEVYLEFNFPHMMQDKQFISRVIEKNPALEMYFLMLDMIGYTDF